MVSTWGVIFRTNLNMGDPNLMTTTFHHPVMVFAMVFSKHLTWETLASNFCRYMFIFRRPSNSNIFDGKGGMRESHFSGEGIAETTVINCPHLSAAQCQRMNVLTCFSWFRWGTTSPGCPTRNSQSGDQRCVVHWNGVADTEGNTFNYAANENTGNPVTVSDFRPVANRGCSKRPSRPCCCGT